MAAKCSPGVSPGISVQIGDEPAKESLSGKHGLGFLCASSVFSVPLW